MNVKRIGIISGILLIISTVLFAISIAIPDIFVSVPNIYIVNQIILPVVGGLVLAFTYTFAIMSYSRELFTINPQRIPKNFSQENGTSSLTIRPYIVDKIDFQIFVKSLKLAVSHNYEITETRFNGTQLPKVGPNTDNEYIYVLNRKASTDLTIITEIKDNGNDTQERFLRFTISYKKKDKILHITYDETHKVI